MNRAKAYRDFFLVTSAARAGLTKHKGRFALSQACDKLGAVDAWARKERHSVLYRDESKID